MKNIEPEDIEDYTDRFIPYFGVEFEADTIKKIHLSLIEHKNEGDYNESDIIVMVMHALKLSEI